jgi:aminoglycoside phosphotransferase
MTMRDWCEQVLGPCEWLDDVTREHAGERASVLRLRAASGEYVLKRHRDMQHWHSEVHAYENWAAACGGDAARLVAVRDEEPRALLITALPGRPIEGRAFAPAVERAAWRDAGRALAQLHALPRGAFFGLCARDGNSIGPAHADACAHMHASFDEWLARGERLGCLTPDERAVVRRAQEAIDAFAGEHPIACHRDYCTPNWLATDDGAWAGMIDFEFAGWDVRTADFSRFAEWNWIARPDLFDALVDGYGRTIDRDQLFVSRVFYAFSAVVWGCEVGYLGFAQEGREALKVLAIS